MLPPVALGAGDVPGLTALVATAEEDDDCPPLPAKVDSVAGAIVDAELVHALPHGFAVAEVPHAKARDTGSDLGSRAGIL